MEDKTHYAAKMKKIKSKENEEWINEKTEMDYHYSKKEKNKS